MQPVVFTRRVLMTRLVFGSAGVLMVLAPIPDKSFVLAAAGLAVISSLLLLPLVRDHYWGVTVAVVFIDSLILGSETVFTRLNGMEAGLLWPAMLAAFVLGPRWAGWTALTAGLWLAFADIVVLGHPPTIDRLLGPPLLLGAIGWLLTLIAGAQEKVAREASESAARFEQILESAPDAILIFDPELSVSRTNPAADATSIGANPEGHDGLLLDDGSSVVEYIRLHISPDGFGPQDLSARRPSGELIHLSISVSPIGGRAAMDGYVAILRDVTALRRQERNFQRLSEAATELAEANDSQSVIRAFLEAARALTQAETSGLVEISGSQCEVVAATGLPTWIDGYRYSTGGGMARAAQSERRTIVRNDYATNSDSHPVFIDFGITAMMDVPLPDSAPVPSVLTVGRTRPNAPFTASDVATMEALAGHAAVALQKAAMLNAQRDIVVELERANAAKDEFLTTVSHELRTPLTTLLGFIQTLVARDHQISAELRRDLMERSLHQGERLKRLIEELLALTAGANGPVPQVRAMDCGTVIKAAVEAADGASGVSFDIDELIALGDPDYLHIAIRNLVENAVKHAGGTEVSVTAKPGRGTVRIAISDHGKGVAPEDRARLFERFFRGTGSSRVPGLGIGLSLVHEYLHAMGGAVHYEAVEPTGSRFVLILPLAPTGLSVTDRV